jgi:hypothetical protein
MAVIGLVINVHEGVELGERANSTWQEMRGGTRSERRVQEESEMRASPAGVAMIGARCMGRGLDAHK